MHVPWQGESERRGESRGTVVVVTVTGQRATWETVAAVDEARAQGQGNQQSVSVQ